MAKYRLLRAHFLPGDKLLMGDQENESLGRPGEIVGDGTPHEVLWPTTDMEPLDDEARAMIKKERERIAANRGAMNPVESLAVDNFDPDFAPSARPHGAPVDRPKPPAPPKA
jgi:hypothetical protein